MYIMTELNNTMKSIVFSMKIEHNTNLNQLEF